MGQAGHKVRDHRSADETCRRRTNERSPGAQAVTPNKNGNILSQKATGDEEKRSTIDDQSLFEEASNSEYELQENDDEPVITSEPGSKLSVDGLKHAWFDSARGEVTLADTEKRTPTRSADEQQFQEIWSTNVDFSSIHCSFTMSSAGEDQSSGDSPLSDENKSQVKIEEDMPESYEKVEDDESRWVMEFKQKGDEVGVSGWNASRVPTSEDFVSSSANEKNCYFQLVGADDDFHALPTMCFEDDYGEKDSVGSCAKISFTDEEDRESGGSHVCEEIAKVCERIEKGESTQKRLFTEERIDERRMAFNVDDGIESFDRSSQETGETTEVEMEGDSPDNSMVRRVCSTVKKMGFISAFMRQWNRDVKKIGEGTAAAIAAATDDDDDDDDQVREREKERKEKNE